MASTKRGTDPLDKNECKRNKLGFEKYANSAILSDVTIRYGDSGQLKFEAHKLILCAKSHWFEAAFTGGFMESEASEVRLFGDDAASLESMLTWVYNGRITLPDVDEYTLSNVLFYIELYRVADKYDVPGLCEALLGHFRVQLLLGTRDPIYSDKGEQTDPSKCEAFCDLINNVYTLPNAGKNHPLVRDILSAMDQSSSSLLRILRSHGKVPVLVVEASRRNAEFGRDVLLHLLGKSDITVDDKAGEEPMQELALVFQVRCPDCDRILRLEESSLSDDGTAYCVACGEHMGYWDDCRVIREQQDQRRSALLNEKGDGSQSTGELPTNDKIPMKGRKRWEVNGLAVGEDEKEPRPRSLTDASDGSDGFNFPLEGSNAILRLRIQSYFTT